MAIVRRRNGTNAPAQGWDLGGYANLFGDFDRLFGELASPSYGRSQWTQGYPVDLYETDDDIVLEMAVPGIQVSDIDISVEGRQLIIKGSLPEAEDENRRYWLKAIPHGEFSRTVTLPTTVDIDEVQANVRNGLLTLTMPKMAEAKVRKITVNTEDS